MKAILVVVMAMLLAASVQAQDFNGDGVVGRTDWKRFEKLYRDADALADLNADAFVNYADFLLFCQAYGKPMAGPRIRVYSNRAPAEGGGFYPLFNEVWLQIEQVASNHHPNRAYVIRVRMVGDPMYLREQRGWETLYKWNLEGKIQPSDRLVRLKQAQRCCAPFDYSADTWLVCPGNTYEFQIRQIHGAWSNTYRTAITNWTGGGVHPRGPG